jgi:hypothetical protein
LSTSHDEQPGGQEMTLPSRETARDLEESLMGMGWQTPFLLK